MQIFIYKKQKKDRAQPGLNHLGDSVQMSVTTQVVMRACHHRFIAGYTGWAKRGSNSHAQGMTHHSSSETQAPPPSS